jgi:ribosome maturation factor RimP
MGALRPFFLRKGSMAFDRSHHKERALFTAIAPQVERHVPGAQVLALELSGRESFRVYVDHPAGVDHALCKRVTDVLRPYLSEYSVEVSSPGSEPPVRTPEHFAKAVGHRVALRTSEEIAGRRRIRGEVLSVGDTGVTVKTEDQPVEVPYEAIVRGNLIDEEVTR